MARKAPETAIGRMGRIIEQRLGLPLDSDDRDHLLMVAEHYQWKRDAILMRHGEAVAVQRADYAKAVLISEAARLMLREIEPKRRRKKRKEPL